MHARLQIFFLIVKCPVVLIPTEQLSDDWHLFAALDICVLKWENIMYKVKSGLHAYTYSIKDNHKIASLPFYWQIEMLA